MTLPLWALAQPMPPVPELSWRDANEAVGQFKRGHADLLKWEQRTLTPATVPPPVVAGLMLASADAAVRKAWMAHRELATPLARLGSDTVDMIAAGRWLDIDPHLIGRRPGLHDVLSVAAQARKAWTQAVISQRAVQPLRNTLEAAQAASELGQRMVNVGNWSKLQQTQVQLAQSSAHMNLRRAQYAATQAHARLLKTLQLTGVHTAAHLPDSLPDLPAQALSDQAFQQRFLAVQAQLPRAERMRHQADAHIAFDAYQASYAVARSTRDEVLTVRALITEETVLHYNGMLKSTWDLLSEVQNQSRAVASAMASQQDFEIARIDLEWVLLGGAPERFVSLGTSGDEAAGSAAH